MNFCETNDFLMNANKRGFLSTVKFLFLSYYVLFIKLTLLHKLFNTKRGK